MSADGSKKVILISLAANIGIALAKLGGALFTGSAALMAEAVHSFADCGNQGLLLYGQHAAARPITKRHPIGHGREVFFWSFVVALLLFSMGGLFSLYEGWHKLHAIEEVASPELGAGILLVAVVLEGISFRACLREVRSQNPHGSIFAWMRNTTSADLLVIFLEDLAALIGLCLAFASLLLTWLTRDPVWDAIGSMAIGVLLVATACVLAREVKSLLIGEAPSTDYEAALAPLVETHIPGGRILRLIALQTGIGQVMLSYKLHPGSLERTADLITSINALERAVKAQFPEIRWQFVEPDIEA